MKLKERIKDNRYLNKRFGKRSLFIEKPEQTYKKVLDYIDNNKVERCFCVPPPNAKLEGLYTKLYIEIKEREIEIIPHIHLKEPNEFMVMSTLWYFKLLGIESKKIVFGWWRDSEPYKRIAENLGLEIIERHYHIYDFWL